MKFSPAVIDAVAQQHPDIPRETIVAVAEALVIVVFPVIEQMMGSFIAALIRLGDEDVQRLRDLVEDKAGPIEQALDGLTSALAYPGGATLVGIGDQVIDLASVPIDALEKMIPVRGDVPDEPEESVIDARSDLQQLVTRWLEGPPPSPPEAPDRVSLWRIELLEETSRIAGQKRPRSPQETALLHFLHAEILRGTGR